MLLTYHGIKDLYALSEHYFNFHLPRQNVLVNSLLFYLIPVSFFVSLLLVLCFAPKNKSPVLSELFFFYCIQKKQSIAHQFLTGVSSS